MGSSDARPAAILKNAFLTGVAVIVPLLITLIVLAIAFNYVYVYLDLLSDAVLPFSPRISIPGYGVLGRELLVEVATPIVLFALILLVGLTANSSRYGELAVSYFDRVIERVPGVGAVYESFRRMSDVMLDSDGEHFQEVVLVEFPTEGVYALAFVTSRTPSSIADPIEESDHREDAGETRTVFLPMAPNPVMGGHVVFVPGSRVVEVDMTVEEGIRALVTSGVAIEESIGEEGGVSPAVSPNPLREFSMVDRLEERLDRDDLRSRDRGNVVNAVLDPDSAVDADAGAESEDRTDTDRTEPDEPSET
jgi:uncharacterized membrane protein